MLKILFMYIKAIYFKFIQICIFERLWKLTQCFMGKCSFDMIRSLWISDWWRFLCRIVGNVVFLAIITLLNTII